MLFVEMLGLRSACYRGRLCAKRSRHRLFSARRSACPVWWARDRTRLFGSRSGHGCEDRHTPHTGTCGREKGESMVLSKDGHGGCRASRSTRGWPGGALVHYGLDNDVGGNKLWAQVKEAYTRRCHRARAAPGWLEGLERRPTRRTPTHGGPRAGGRPGTGAGPGSWWSRRAQLRLGYDRHSLDSPLLVVRTYVLASGRRAPDA